MASASPAPSAAVKRGPSAKITLRNGARIIDQEVTSGCSRQPLAGSPEQSPQGGRPTGVGVQQLGAKPSLNPHLSSRRPGRDRGSGW
jgi:hypothetical protein